MPRWALIGVLCAGAFLATAVAGRSAAAAEACRAPRGAEALSRVWYAPCDEADAARASLVLPLPAAGATMSFRPVETPGREIFSRCVPEGRSLVFGDPQDPFAQVRRRAVTGAFRTEDGWRSWLATYELSVGQAAAILAGDPVSGAEGALRDGLVALAGLMEAGRGVEGGNAPATAGELRAIAELFDPDAPDPAVMRTLALPVSGLSPGDFDRLTEHFSSWCYRNGPCMATLQAKASQDGAPGFFRLPSEVEWEYATRGGARETRFAAPLAVERGALRRHAVLGGFERGGEAQRAAIGVGRAPTPGGFYDLYGNVSELTIDYFSSEYGSGKYGGRAARGGSFLTPHDVVGSGFREEAPLYRFGAEGGEYQGAYRSESLGARFAIGSVVKSDESFLREAREAARSAQCAVAGEDDPLGERLRGLASSLASNVEDEDLSSRLARDAEDTRRALSERTQNLCRILATNMVELSRAQVATWIQFYDTEALIREVDDLAANHGEYYLPLIEKYRKQQENYQTLAEEYFDKYVDAMNSMSAHGRSCFVDGFEHARGELERRGPSRRLVSGAEGAYGEAEAIAAAARHSFEGSSEFGVVERWSEEFNKTGAALAGETPRRIQR